MIEELKKVVGILENVQVDGRFWLSMVACTNSIKNVIRELEQPATSEEVAE